MRRPRDLDMVPGSACSSATPVLHGRWIIRSVTLRKTIASTDGRRMAEGMRAVRRCPYAASL